MLIKYVMERAVILGRDDEYSSLVMIITYYILSCAKGMGMRL